MNQRKIFGPAEGVANTATSFTYITQSPRLLMFAQMLDAALAASHTAEVVAMEHASELGKSTTQTSLNHDHDPIVNSTWVSEGEMAAPTSSPFQECVSMTFLLLSVLPLCVSIGGFVSNALVIITLSRVKKTNSTLYLIRTLAVIDIFVLATTLFSVFVNNGLDRIQISRSSMVTVRSYLVRYMRPFSFLFRLASIWGLVLMTLQRFLSVFYPTCQLFKISRMIYWIAGLLLFSAIYSLPKFFEYSLEVLPTNQVRLQQAGFVKTTLYKNFYTFTCNLFAFFLLPWSSLCYMTYHLCKKLTSVMARKHVLSTRVHQRWKLTKVLLTVVLTFLLMQLAPSLYFISSIATNEVTFGRCGSYGWYLLVATTNSILLNSAINCLIYISSSKEFRTLVCTRKQQRRVGPGVVQNVAMISVNHAR